MQDIEIYCVMCIEIVSPVSDNENEKGHGLSMRIKQVCQITMAHKLLTECITEIWTETVPSRIEEIEKDEE